MGGGVVVAWLWLICQREERMDIKREGKLSGCVVCVGDSLKE